MARRRLLPIQVIVLVLVASWRQVVFTPALPAARADGPAPSMRSTRAEAQAAYRNVLQPALQVPIGWTGSTATCDAGAPSQPAQDATLAAINYFREMASLTTVTLNPANSVKAQQAALMMEANNQLSHTPPNSWRCYSPTGAEAAGSSNLALGAAGAEAISLYMDDTGITSAGHRTWVLNPVAATMGSGSTGRANALWVFSDHLASPPATTPEFVAWPPQDYTPGQLLPSMWSLSPGSNAQQQVSFAGATIFVYDLTEQREVTVRRLESGSTLTFEVDHGFQLGQRDREYDIMVDGITVDGVATQFAWRTIAFDPSIETEQTLAATPPAAPVYGDVWTAPAATNAGLPVTYTSFTPAVCTVSANQIRMIATGSCEIGAHQPGNIRWNELYTSWQLQVGPRPLKVVANDAVKLRGQPNPPLNATVTNYAPGDNATGAAVTGSASCTTTATTTSATGRYPITCTRGTLNTTNPKYTWGQAVAGTLTVAADYNPVAPVRLLETRAGQRTIDHRFEGVGRIGDGATIKLAVTGRAGSNVPAGAAAVVLNVTAISPERGGYLTVYPGSEPNASSLNYIPGQTTPNLVITQVAADGTIRLTSRASATDLVVDIVGWYPA